MIYKITHVEIDVLIFKTISSPKDGSYPHDIAVVQDIVREQGKGWVTFVSHTRIYNATGQEGTGLHGERHRCKTKKRGAWRASFHSLFSPVIILRIVCVFQNIKFTSK